MDNVRVNILSANNVVIGHLDNSAPEALHYYNEILHTYLEGSVATFSFTAPADHVDSGLLEAGNKISFYYKEDPYFFNIVKAEQTEQTIQVTAYGTCLELLNTTVASYNGTSMTFAQYLNAFLAGSTFLSLGLNEVSDKTISNEWTGESTLLARLYSLANVFSAELEFVPRLSDNGSLIALTLNVYKQHSDTAQGLGTIRTDKILRYGQNVTGIRKNVDATELFTSITPYGAENLDITSIAETITDDDGNTLYYTTAGSPTIYAPQARDRYPSSAAEDDDRYINLVWTTEYTTAAALYGNALAKLKTGSEPKASYEVEGFYEAHIGDTVTIADQDFNPPLYLRARVVEQEICFTDPSKNKTKFDNFTEMIAEIAPVNDTGVDETARTMAAEAVAAAEAAQETADGKNKTYRQAAAPTGLTAGDAGDLWVDTDDGNKLYRWSGSAWVDVQDGAIAAAQGDATQALSDAADAQGDATQALADAATAQADIDNLQIGAVNLARDTGDFGASNWVLSRSTAADGLLTVTPTTSTAAAKYKIDYLLYGDHKDKTYTLSFDMRYLTGGTYSDPKTVRAYIGVNPIARIDNVFSSTYDRLGYKDFTPTTSWARYSCTFKVPDDLTSGASGALVDTSYLTFEFYKAGSGAAVEIKNIMFEEGTRATGWQPAPEDVAADITEVKAMAQSTQNYFWHDTNGAHVSDTAGDASTTGVSNVLIDANGMAIRDGSTELATFGASVIELGKNSSSAGVELIDGQLWFDSSGTGYGSINAGTLNIVGNDAVDISANGLTDYITMGASGVMAYAPKIDVIYRPDPMTPSSAVKSPLIPYASATPSTGVYVYRQLNMVTMIVNKTVTFTANTALTLATLPAAYRPPFAFPIVMQMNTSGSGVPLASARCVIGTDGTVKATTSANRNNVAVYGTATWITNASMT